MLTSLRAQVQTALYAVPARRKPALRRSDAANALFATDLPLIAEDNAVDAFCKAMAEQGWHTDIRKGWLILDARVPVPEYTVPAVLSGACGSCISILLRHADNAPADDYIRALVKAADAGMQPFEKLCHQLHEEFAARLRNHRPLPAGLLPYLCQAYQTLY